jgi:hypothetical protein
VHGKDEWKRREEKRNRRGEREISGALTAFVTKLNRYCI